MPPKTVCTSICNNISIDKATASGWATPIETSKIIIAPSLKPIPPIEIGNIVSSHAGGKTTKKYIKGISNPNDKDSK